jgi:hypothetical protein
MTDRKKPVRHIVSSYKRKNRTVRSYARGNGLASSKPKGKIIKSFIKSEENRWEQIADGPDYQWRSKENPDITVNVNLEEMENDLDYEDEDSPDTYKVYLVFPSHDGRGIPDTPDQYSEGSSGSIESAKKEAIEMAHRIMKHPIEKIERFNWNMVD